MAEQKDIGAKPLDELTFAVLEALLIKQADLYNALMKYGYPYTKMILGGPNVPNAQ